MITFKETQELSEDPTQARYVANTECLYFPNDKAVTVLQNEKRQQRVHIGLYVPKLGKVKTSKQQTRIYREANSRVPEDPSASVKCPDRNIGRRIIPDALKAASNAVAIEKCADTGSP